MPASNSSEVRPDRPAARTRPRSDDVRSPPPGRTGNAVLRAAVLSIGLHAIAVVLLARGLDFQPAPERAAPELVRMTLMPRSVPEPPAADADADDTPRADDLAGPGETPIADRPATPPEPPAPTTNPAPRVDRTPPPEADPAASASVDLARLRAQVRTLAPLTDDAAPADGLGASRPEATLPWAETGSAIRGLPLGGGWLNPYVGPVRPYSETWGAPNGEQRGFFVLANGQAVCTRVDAPTNDEMKNPWMSMRVTYMRLCGRVRGTAPPPDDLDYAPAPAALRQSADGVVSDELPSGDVVP